MGAVRKPLAIHKLEGTLAPYRHAKEHPRPRPIAPKCPQSLEPAAREHWRKLAPRLERLGLLTEIDGPAFERYCRYYSLWVQAREEIDRDGATVPGYRGGERKHPALTTLFRCEALMGEFMKAFGLTPLSRSRLNITEPSDEEHRRRMLD
jgi:P27 family predicted phage terminase small subunit